MRYALPQNQRYELATKIGFFLISKGLKTWDMWKGRLSKSEQIQAFGFYMGKGFIVVDGERDEISMTIKVCFGTDFYEPFFVSARTGLCSVEWGREAPIDVFNLYSPLNNFREVAA